MSWLPLGDHDPGWFLRWLSLFGIGLFGVGFLAGSLTAPRNPMRGGILFLASCLQRRFAWRTRNPASWCGTRMVAVILRLRCLGRRWD